MCEDRARSLRPTTCSMDDDYTFSTMPFQMIMQPDQEQWKKVTGVTADFARQAGNRSLYRR